MNKRGINKRIRALLVLTAMVLGLTAYQPNLAKSAVKTKLKAKTISISIGQKKKIKLAGKKAKARYTFKSSKKKVAKVSKAGVVTGKKSGTAKITVREIYKKKTRKIGVVKVTVKKKNNSSAAPSGLTFRYESYLLEHYEKHGKEMGFSSPEAYLARANEVVKDPASLHKLEAEDGDHVYYLEATNDLVIVSTDGYIRTYFRPNDGIDYFNRQ